MAKNRHKGGKKRRERSAGSHKRQRGKHSPRKSILIVCEGRETEPNYFNQLKSKLNLPLVEVVVKGTGKGHAAVVKHAVQLTEKRAEECRSPKQRRRSWTKVPFDEVWCVFDFEERRYRPQFYQAVKEAKENGFNLAVSNPAFEYWYLLHFEQSVRYFTNANEVIQALCKHLPDYGKSKNVFDKVYPHTDSAIQRGKRVLEKRANQREPYPNPSTLVFKLVETLKKMSI